MVASIRCENNDDITLAADTYFSRKRKTTINRQLASEHDSQTRLLCPKDERLLDNHNLAKSVINDSKSSIGLVEYL